MASAPTRVVRGFARHLAAIDPLTEVLPAGLLPTARTRATPYLYSGALMAPPASSGRCCGPPPRPADLFPWPAAPREPLGAPFSLPSPKGHRQRSDQAAGHLGEVISQSSASGEVVYLTDHGERVAAIMPAQRAAILDGLLAVREYEDEHGPIPEDEARRAHEILTRTGVIPG